jgi:hypothetical protein
MVMRRRSGTYRIWTPDLQRTVSRCAASGEQQEGPVRRYIKKDFPVWNVRRLLEPGPIVLVSSAHDDQANIMTMGWHMVMEFSPALIGCLISSGNHSFELIRKSQQCVINIPTVDLATTVVKIGNCSGRDTDKFPNSA